MAIQTDSKLWIYIMISIYKAGICKTYGCVKNLKIVNMHERADKITMKVGDKIDPFDRKSRKSSRRSWVVWAKYFFKLCKFINQGGENVLPRSVLANACFK